MIPVKIKGIRIEGNLVHVIHNESDDAALCGQRLTGRNRWLHVRKQVSCPRCWDKMQGDLPLGESIR